MKKFKKSLILICCLSTFCATGLPSYLSGGIFMKEIPLSTQSKSILVALVDDEDYERVSQYNWSAKKGNSTFYAHRGIKNNNGKSTTILLHRFILEVTETLDHVDHIDHNGLNCQKINLRIAKNYKNAKNRTGYGKSIYLGVSWVPHLMKWKSEIRFNGKRKHLGVHLLEEDAARAYDDTAKFIHGEFANLNFK